MKNFILLLATSALMLSLQSCEDLTIAFEDVVIENELDIYNLTPKSASITNEMGSFTFNESTTISLSDANDSNGDEDLGDYLESLASITITSMDFTITNVMPVGQESTVDQLTVRVLDNSTLIYTESFSNIVPGTPVNAAGLNSEVFDAISEVLLGNGVLTLEASGEVSGNIESFTVLTQIISDVEANALDAAGTFF